jgi:hypothetical protein
MFRSAGLYVNAVHPVFLISNRARKNNVPLVFKQTVVAFVIEITYGCNCCHCLFLSEIFASISISYLNTKSRSCHYTYGINRLIRIISFLLIFQFTMIPETTKNPESICRIRAESASPYQGLLPSDRKTLKSEAPYETEYERLRSICSSSYRHGQIVCLPLHQCSCG